MNIKAFAVLLCLILVSCASNDRPASGPIQFPISVNELLLLTRGATLEQIEAKIGPPPRKGKIVDDFGLFETPDHYWIERVVYYGEDRRRSIAVLISAGGLGPRSEEHTSELQSLMRISYAVFCSKKKKLNKEHDNNDVKK